MKSSKLVTFMLMLLISAGVLAEGGKERGDVGQGSIVQDQVRVVVPPAQWSATDTPLVGAQVELDEAPDAGIDEADEELF